MTTPPGAGEEDTVQISMFHSVGDQSSMRDPFRRDNDRAVFSPAAPPDAEGFRQ